MHWAKMECVFILTKWFDEEEKKKSKIDTWDGSVGG